MRNKFNQTLFKKKGCPNWLNNDLLKKVSDVMIGTRAAKEVISSCLVIEIGKGVAKANNPTMLMESGGLLELTEDGLELC